MNTIDCVIPWVDGSDTEWIKKKNNYLGDYDKQNQDAGDDRYRDFGTLKYLFRGIEKYMPWIRNVVLVTNGQRPEWLNVSCPRLLLIDHTDFIPNKYLPTFSSHPIELNLHRISGLSENFIYFNDDIFVLKKTEEKDFFKNGLPCDAAVLDAITLDRYGKAFGFYIPLNDIEVINRNFDKKACIRNNRWKYYNLKYGRDLIRTICLIPWNHFTGFHVFHLPCSLKKSVLEELWEKEYEVLDRTCRNKFRNSADVNVWLAQYWQYASGKFTPRNPKIGCCRGLFDDMERNLLACDHIRKQKTKLIVINDNIVEADVDEISKNLISSFESILPDKSSFEL